MTAGGLRDRLGWYRQRLRSMGPAEMAYRVGEQVLRRAARYRIPDFDAWLPADPAPLVPLPGLEAGLRQLAAVPGVLDGWRRLRDRVAAGRFRLLGQDWPQTGPGLAPDWHLDPVSGRRWPSARYCFDIPYRQAPGFGDVKYVWELNRLQHLQPLAALAHLEGDEAAAALCTRHIESWLAATPPFRGVAWASGIELALRAVSLVLAAGLLGPRLPPPLRRRLLVSLAAHGWWLARYPSRHSSANNHAVAEAAGLLLIGSVLRSLPRASGWMTRGRGVLEREAALQILPDGVGAEQSVSYTAFTAEWLLLSSRVAEAAGRPLAPVVGHRLALAGEFLRAITDAGGNRPAVGDDDDGRVLGSAGEVDYAGSVLSCIAAACDRPGLAPPVVTPHLRQALLGFAGPAVEAPPGIRCFPRGGYTVARSSERGREALWLMDHGPLGYLSIAAHGHADALAVWLHLGGRPVLVDAGTFLYHAGGDWRTHFRSTPAHNTLSIAGASSSRMAGAFNWSERASAAVTEVRDDPQRWSVTAEHDGWLARHGCRHRRRLSRLSEGAFEIEDSLWFQSGATARLPVEIGFLLAPDLEIVPDGEGWMVREEGRPLLAISHSGPLAGRVQRGQATPPRGWHSPRFGECDPAFRLVFAGELWQATVARIVLKLPPA